MSKNYNQEKINKFLEKGYSYYFDKKRGNSYILNKDNFPISAIMTTSYKYKNENENEINYSDVNIHFSSENLGKIHYYLLMMELEKENTFLKPALIDDLTEITENIWYSIMDDKTVNKNKLELDFEYDENKKIGFYAFNKKPDELYKKAKKKRKNFFSDRQLSYLDDVCMDIFNEIYDNSYDKEEIKELIKENTNEFKKFRKNDKKLKI